jgi:uncharacterized membrane protein YcaP (DUF421 family)
MEIVVRAVVLFVFLYVITRVSGRSTLGELSAFQLLLYVVMGDLVQQAVTQQDYSVTGGVLAVSVFALLTVAAGAGSRRWTRFREPVHGVPYVVVRDGEPMMDALRLERMSIDDLLVSARQQGIERFSDIELAVLETNGRVSFFTRTTPRDGAAEPPEQLD